MHALIRLGDGKYYVSAVFGYYRNITATGDYQRYLEGVHKLYWIVWDSEKKRLIRWLAMVILKNYSNESETSVFLKRYFTDKFWKFRFCRASSRV